MLPFFLLYLFIYTSYADGLRKIMLKMHNDQLTSPAYLFFIFFVSSLVFCCNISQSCSTVSSFIYFISFHFIFPVSFILERNFHFDSLLDWCTFLLLLCSFFPRVLLLLFIFITHKNCIVLSLIYGNGLRRYSSALG